MSHSTLESSFSDRIIQDTVARQEADIRNLMEQKQIRETKTDTISRDNHLLKSKLEQLQQEQQIKMKSETRLKIGTLKIYLKSSL